MSDPHPLRSLQSFPQKSHHDIFLKATFYLCFQLYVCMTVKIKGRVHEKHLKAQWSIPTLSLRNGIEQDFEEGMSITEGEPTCRCCFNYNLDITSHHMNTDVQLQPIIYLGKSFYGHNYLNTFCENLILPGHDHKIIQLHYIYIQQWW